MLLIATNSPFVSPLPTDVTDADLLLTQDAVIAITLNYNWQRYNKVYALASDVKARALEDHSNQQIQLIDIADFVKLTAQHQPIVNWS